MRFQPQNNLKASRRPRQSGRGTPGTQCHEASWIRRLAWSLYLKGSRSFSLSCDRVVAVKQGNFLGIERSESIIDKLQILLKNSNITIVKTREYWTK